MLSQLSSRMFRNSRLFGLTSSLVALGLGCFAPSFAAEKVVLKYGPFQESLLVQDLRTYAQTRQASPQLAGLLGLLSPEDQAQFYEFLQLKTNVDAVRVNQFLGSQRGKTILFDAAKVTLRPDRTGEQALQSTLVQGAQSTEGIGVISFLEKYPEPVIRIDVIEARKFYQLNQDLIPVNQTLKRQRQLSL